MAHSFSGRAEAGYRFALTDTGITPYVAGQWQMLRTPSYTERDVTNLTAFALGYESHTTTDTRSEIGVRFDGRLALDNGTLLVLRARGAWAQAYDPERTSVASFLALPGTGFTVTGATPATDSALAAAWSELRFASSLTLSAKFDAEIAAHAHVYAGTAARRYNW